MNESVTTTLFIGARGWDHDVWAGGYYPDDLPPEWRLSYYANEYSAVLVPWADWACGKAEAQQWLEDTPEGFRFVLEVAPDCRDLGSELRAVEPLRPRIGALLVDHAEVLVDDAERLVALRQASGDYPLGLEIERLQALSPEQRAVLERVDAGVVWQPNSGEGIPGPVPLGLVDGAEKLSPREVRTVVEDFLTNAVTRAQAMLFFRGQPPRIDNLVTAQTVAALLGC